MEGFDARTRGKEREVFGRGVRGGERVMGGGNKGKEWNRGSPHEVTRRW